MGIIKYVERLRTIDYLIKNSSTGNSQQFSRKLGISVSQLKDDIREMRELGATIEFCRHSNSYVYTGNCKLILKFISSNESSSAAGR
jgi:hypothetical protein